MARVRAPLYSLNGGEVGDEALARLDLERLQFAGSLYQNMLPRVIGSMTLRPGLEHIADIDIGDVQLLEYAYSGSAGFVPILSDEEMRILYDDSLVTRASVSTAITNGAFSSFTGWSDDSTGSASAGVSGGNLVLTGKTREVASATQTISVSGGDQGVEHGLRIDVVRGPVTVRLGSTSGAIDLLPAGEVHLDDGVHSIAFTPATSNIYLELKTNKARTILVNSCTIDSSGTLVIPTPWTDTDLNSQIIRYNQSLDKIYVASGSYQQREIQRRSNTSWGVQRYKVDDGPFTLSDGAISIQPNGYTGIVTLTASKDHFDDDMIGRLYRLVQSGQFVEETFTSDPAEGAFVRVSGVDTARRFSWVVSGTFTGTIRLQVATDDGSGTTPGAWSDVLTRTSTGSNTYTDSDDNVIKYFRWALQTGDLSSGSVTASITYSGGSRAGVARITNITSATEADADVLSRFYSTNATFDWDYSTWSDYDGWPNSVQTFGGRLYWHLAGTAYGSVPDSYNSFDDTIAGDSAPIIRSVGTTSQRGALWMLGLQRLIAGTDVSEISVKASGFDEPLSASAWFPVDISTRGSANLRAVKADKDGIFVQSSGLALFRLTLDQGGFDYSAIDLTAMHEEICDGSQIVDITVQRRPDTIIWIVLANGEARALTYEPSESVIAWSRIVTDGTFKRVAASRSAGQDDIHFVVVRDGTQRLERLADFSECRGGSLNCMADGFSRFTATAAQTTFSVPHLDGLDVVVWADGVAIHDQDDLYTVSSNQVVIAAQDEGASVVIGLPYTGRWKSTKLAYGAQGGTALMQRKRIAKLGLYLVNTMLDGLKAGYSFDQLRNITTREGGKAIPAGTLYETFDADLLPISSNWSTDSRVCVEAKAPYPFTAAAMVFDADTQG